MIVATDVFVFDDVKAIIRHRGDIRGYVDGLVPSRYKHVEAIAHNTRYLLNLQVLKSGEFTLDEKSWINSELTRGLHVVGYMDCYITCSELERAVNIKKVERYNGACG